MNVVETKILYLSDMDIIFDKGAEPTGKVDLNWFRSSIVRIAISYDVIIYSGKFGQTLIKSRF